MNCNAIGLLARDLKENGGVNGVYILGNTFRNNSVEAITNGASQSLGENLDKLWKCSLYNI